VVSMTTTREQVEKIKQLINQKFDINANPEKDQECVIIRELIVAKSYSVEVGVGKCWKYPGYFDIVGFVFEESRDMFIESSVRIDTKTKTKSTFFVCGVAKNGFIRMVDEARWENKLNTLEDLIVILEKL